MKSTSAALLLFDLVFLAPSAAHALEPEMGTFGGYGPPDPYHLALRQRLLGDDSYRLCQMLVIPSFSEETAVYMVRADEPAGSYTVISRTMTKQAWAEMQERMEKQSQSEDSYEMGPESQAAALRSIELTVETRKAPLDADLAKRLDAACLAVLERTRFPHVDPRLTITGADGTTYHAGHWVRGQFLAGQTWSPSQGSLDWDFVEMEIALQNYARSAEADRAAMQDKLTGSLASLERHLAAPETSDE